MSAESNQGSVGPLRTPVGGLHASTAATQFVRGGLAEFPVLMTDLLALTIIVLGVPTVFSAYHMSAISEWGGRYE